MSFGIGWIFGFLVRWGVHHYYIDPLGHCTAPKVYEYSRAKSDYAAGAVNITRIKEFYEFFTRDDTHQAGSSESEKFAHHVRNMWNKTWNLDAVSIETTKVTLPISTLSAREIMVGSSTNEEDVEMATELVSRSATVRVPLGRRMKLTCTANGVLTNHRIIWKKRSDEGNSSSKVLSVDHIIVEQDRRLRTRTLADNKTVELSIDSVQESDAGIYECSLSTQPPKAVDFTVTVGGEGTEQVVVIGNLSLGAAEVAGNGGGAAVLKKVVLNGRNSAEVAYSKNGVAKGKLAYGQDLEGNLNGSVALIGLPESSRDNAGTVVLIAQLAGAVGVIFYPADNSSSTAKDLVVKFCPGDPHSPYNPSPESAVMPKIPVLSVSREVGTELLSLDKSSAIVEFAVNVSERPNAVLRSVLGTIRGRYEPTRYVIVGAHHDTWAGGGTKRAGLAHAAIMELVRVFAMMKHKRMPPGRSIVFASWDGEQLGGLGSPSWYAEI